mmetsp:Transcript_37178/g.69218  ORF Transcript_37178/g.69218 Transcript_37178/m.69218 type:complete len:250 (-) Transcript_37178:418-1167(-)
MWALRLYELRHLRCRLRAQACVLQCNLQFLRTDNTIVVPVAGMKHLGQRREPRHIQRRSNIHADGTLQSALLAEFAQSLQRLAIQRGRDRGLVSEPPMPQTLVCCGTDALVENQQLLAQLPSIVTDSAQPAPIWALLMQPQPFRCIIQVLRQERELATEHPEENTADTPNVTLGSEIPSPDLWSHGGARASLQGSAALLGTAMRRNQLCHAEVNNHCMRLLQIISAQQHDVFTLEVLVQNTSGMTVHHC